MLRSPNPFRHTDTWRDKTRLSQYEARKYHVLHKEIESEIFEVKSSENNIPKVAQIYSQGACLKFNMQIYVKEEKKDICCKKKSQSQPNLNVRPQSSQTSFQDLKEHYLNRSHSLDSAGKSGKIPKVGSKESHKPQILDQKTQNLKRNTVGSFMDQCDNMKVFCRQMKMKAEELQQDLDVKKESDAVKSSSARIAEKLKLMQEICQGMRKKVSEATAQFDKNGASDNYNKENENNKNSDEVTVSQSLCDKLSKIKQTICKLAAEDHDDIKPQSIHKQSVPQRKNKPPGVFKKFVEALMDKKSKYHIKDNEDTINTASDISRLLEERGISCILYTAGYTPEEVKNLVTEQLRRDEEIKNKNNETMHDDAEDEKPIFKISAWHNEDNSYFTSLKTNAVNIYGCIRDIISDKKVAFVILY